jgi:COP9 signalosome complex subunit 3
MKTLRAIGKAYEALADDFEQRNWRKFQAEMDAGMQIWLDDGNSRLVNEAGNALLRYRVIDLQKTYAVLPVGRVAYHLDMSVDMTLRLLRDMLQQGTLSASITPSASNNTADAVLHFHHDITTNATNKSEELDLESRTSRIALVTSYLQHASHRLQLSKEYVEVQKRNKRGAAGPDGELADQMDLSWDAPIPGLMADDDEDGEDIRFMGGGPRGGAGGGPGGVGRPIEIDEDDDVEVEDDDEDIMAS